MRPSTHRKQKVAASVMTLALLASACGSDGDDATPATEAPVVTEAADETPATT